MINICFFIRFPTDSESFSIWLVSCRFIELSHIVSVWSRLFFRVSKNYFRDWLFIPFSKCTRLWWTGRRNFWFYYVGILNFLVFESRIFRKRIFMCRVSPCSRRLVPVWGDFLKRNICIVKNGIFVRFIVRIEISRMRLITTHVLSREHAFIFLFIWVGSLMILHTNRK